MTKFRTRILPQLLAGLEATGKLPPRLTFALAALIAFYQGERNGESYPLQDDERWLVLYQQLWADLRDQQINMQQLAHRVLSDSSHWEQDLTQVPGLVDRVAEELLLIQSRGMRAALARYR